MSDEHKTEADKLADSLRRIVAQAGMNTFNGGDHHFKRLIGSGVKVLENYQNWKAKQPSGDVSIEHLKKPSGDIGGLIEQLEIAAGAGDNHCNFVCLEAISLIQSQADKIERLEGMTEQQRMDAG